MLPRIVLVVIALFVLWRVLVALGRRSASGGLGADSYSRFSPQQRRRRKEAVHGSSVAREELVRCSECGTYVPTGRALIGEADGEVRCRACRPDTRYDGRHET